MKTKAIRIIERQILKWPNVRRQENKVKGRASAGRVSYYAGIRHFAFIEKDLLVLIRTTPEERQELASKWAAGPYISPYGGKKVGFELQIPLDETNAVEMLPYLKRSYQHALTWKGV